MIPASSSRVVWDSESLKPYIKAKKKIGAASKMAADKAGKAGFTGTS